MGSGNMHISGDDHVRAILCKSPATGRGALSSRIVLNMIRRGACGMQTAPPPLSLGVFCEYYWNKCNKKLREPRGVATRIASAQWHGERVHMFETPKEWYGSGFESPHSCYGVLGRGRGPTLHVPWEWDSAPHGSGAVAIACHYASHKSIGGARSGNSHWACSARRRFKCNPRRYTDRI